MLVKVLVEIFQTTLADINSFILQGSIWESPLIKLIEKTPAIIETAARGPLAIFALVIIALSLIGLVFFKNASVKVKVCIFVSIFASVVLLGITLFGASSTEEPASSKYTYYMKDIFKLLDLRERKQLPEDQKLINPVSKVVLINNFRLKRLKKEPHKIIFRRATTGFGIEGESVTHPENFSWVNVTEREVGLGEDPHLKRRYEMHVDLNDLAVGASTLVKNKITYINAFQTTNKEWFHTDILFPTQSLTIVLLFPDNKPCKKIRGVYKMETEGFKDYYVSKPVRFLKGRVAYWRIDKPDPGFSYQLEWEW
jgi:hypothetical protein